MSDKSDESIEARANRWLLYGEVGASSKAICKHMLMGSDPRVSMEYPRDIADFGRCCGLLKMIPEWRDRIEEMRVYGPGWQGLTREWDKIEAAYQNAEEYAPLGATTKLIRLAIAQGYGDDPAWSCTFHEDGTLASAQRANNARSRHG